MEFEMVYGIFKIMYLVNFGLLKSLKLTNDHLEVGNLKRMIDAQSNVSLL
jgi:hypothetical protein